MHLQKCLTFGGAYHNGAFFLQSFFFAPVVPKKKRRSPFADIVSVHETAFSEVNVSSG